ncbi:MAG: hypothetical protein JXR16_08525 [Bermanella sp.]
MKYIMPFMFYVLCIANVFANEASLQGAQLPSFSAWSWEGINNLHPASQNSSLGKLSISGQEITIQPNGSAFFSVPKGYWLRLISHVYSPKAGIQPDSKILKPDLWYSTGNGLFIPAFVQSSRYEIDNTKKIDLEKNNFNKKISLEPAKQWTMTSPVDKDLIVMLKNPSDQKVNWYISRAFLQKTIIDESMIDIISSNKNDMTWHFESHPGKHVQLSQLEKHQRYEIELNGPGQWKLETRLMQDAWQPWQRFVNISLKLNENHWKDWRIHPNIDNSRTLESNHCERLSSHPETIKIYLPKGKHRLSFDAPQIMGVRIAKIGDELLFEHNQSSQLKKNDSTGIHSAKVEYEYDGILLKDYLSGNIKHDYLNFFQKENEDQQDKIIKTIDLIQQRYHVWRPLIVKTNKIEQKSAWLIDVKKRNEHDGRDRFILNDDGLDRAQKILHRVNPAQEIILQSPLNQPDSLLKLSFSLQDKPFEITLKNRHGKKETWYWHPDLMDKSTLDSASNNDFSALALEKETKNIRALAVASGSISLTQDDFPITVRNSSNQAVWLSPSYRGALSFSLDEETWLRALEQLGVKQMLALLKQTKRPLEQSLNQTSSKQWSDAQHLADLVWQDWQPLRSWLLSYQKIWSQRLIHDEYEKNPIRYESLAALIERLNEKGDFALLSQTLKAIAVKDSDKNRQDEAMNWLLDYYMSNEDSSNLSAYHSWKFLKNPEQHLSVFAKWLLSQGQSKMALRLFKLDNTVNGNLAYQQALLQESWRQHDNEQSPLLNVWHALWFQDWKQAKNKSDELIEGSPWKDFLKSIPSKYNPAEWMSWIATSPNTYIHKNEKIGDELHIPITLSTDHNAGFAQLYQPQRNLYFQMALSNPITSADYSVIGPIEMYISVRLKHKNNDENLTIDDWIEIENNGNKNWFPLINSHSNTDIELLSDDENLVGNRHIIKLKLGSGLHKLKIRPLIYSSLVSAQVLSRPLFSNVVKSIQKSASSVMSDFKSNNDEEGFVSTFRESLLVADSLLNDINITYLNECRESNGGFLSESYQRNNVAWSQSRLASDWEVKHGLKKITSISHTKSDNPLKDVNEIEQHLLNGLWKLPKLTPEQSLNWVTQANSIAHPYQRYANIRLLNNKINSNYSFQPVDMIIASAGTRRTKGRNESEFIAEREKQLWLGKKPVGERLYGYNQLGFITRFNRETPVRLILNQVRYPYQQAPFSEIRINLNNKLLKTINLSPTQKTFVINIPAGQQRVTFALLNPSKEHWVYVQAQANFNGKWQAIINPDYKRYEVATTAQPLELYLDRPSWLRIDKYVGGKVTHEYQYQSESGSLLLKPMDGERQLMLRVLSLQENTDKERLETYSFETHNTGFPHNATLALQPPTRAIDKFVLSGNHLESIGNDTDGVYVQYQSRRDFDSDAENSVQEKFIEVGWRHRKKLNCLSCYWRSDLFSRKHTQNNIGLVGTQQWLQGAWAQSSWSWQITHSLYLQTTESVPFKWSALGSLKYSHGINNSLRHGHQVDVFTRYFSENSPDFFTDNDVYSSYQNQHKWGVRIEETITGRPWFDSFWRGHLRLVSNELDTSSKAEYAQVGFGIRQYFRPVEVGLDYHHRSYLKDEDRKNIINKPILGLQINYWQGFTTGEMLQWKLSVTNDLDQGEYAVLLEASWNMSRGRGLNDYRPSETAFYDLHRSDVHAAFQPGVKNEE